MDIAIYKQPGGKFVAIPVNEHENSEMDGRKPDEVIHLSTPNPDNEALMKTICIITELDYNKPASLGSLVVWILSSVFDSGFESGVKHKGTKTNLGQN